MMEHSLFLHMGLEDPELKDTAFALYKQWELFIRDGYQGDLEGLITELRSFKETILRRLEAGEWLGWLGTAFVSHILEELLMFQNLVNGIKLGPEEQAAQALDWFHDHAASAEGFIDPTEKDYKQIAMELSERFEDEAANAKNRSQPTNDLEFLIGLTIRSGEDLDKFLDDIQTTKPRTVIHPLLLRHWRDEGHHLLAELQAL